MHRFVCAAGVVLLLVSCTPADHLAPTMDEVGAFSTMSIPAVRISEIHYDNAGTDAGEAIEISGPAGTDLTSWSVVLYNGATGLRYDTRALSGTIPATCGDRGVVVLDYPVNGIQNGAPDGMALVNGTTVVEFLSYEGIFGAVDGPAVGMRSTDIGAADEPPPAAGLSLQRSGADVWSAPSANTFGACNDDVVPPPPPEVASVQVAPGTATLVTGGTQAFTATAFDAAQEPIAGVSFTWSTTAPDIAIVNANGLATALAAGDAGIVATAPNGVAGAAQLHVNEVPPPPAMPDTRFSEVHYDNVGTDAGEAIEIEGAAGTDLTGWSVLLYNGNGGMVYNTRALSGTIPAMCDSRGVVVLTYPQDGIQNGSPDGMALVDANSQVVEFLSYEGTLTATAGPAAGLTSVDIVASESSAPVGQSLQRDAFNHWSLATSTFGACNGGGTPPPPTSTITFSGRLPSDPPLPVGFEDQLFATLRDPAGAVVPTATFTWGSEAPSIARIDADGVIHALSAGTLTVRATANDGTTATFSLPTRVAVLGTASYAGNAEFGEPADADPSDDFIVRHPEYTSSYNVNRGEPNWVSYDLDASHFGPEDRCDCFTFDPDLPASFPRYTTADYTGSGAIAGYGIDRGHLARSFDRTSGSLDNAFTFLFSNIVPQAADLNQGPWALLENALGDSARFANREVYIIAGGAGTTGTLKNEGKIVIPESMWKVAVILPRDHGLADVHSYRDAHVIAVIMPNEPGIRNDAWQRYQTTVDAVEALSGYDLLALLPDPIEIALESNTQPPTAVADGPYTSLPHLGIAMSAAGSSDPDGDALTYAWSFGDETGGTGALVSHAYAAPGTYTVRLIATDIRGLSDTTHTTAVILTPAQALDDAARLVDQLIATHVLEGADGPWVSNKLAIARKLVGQANVTAVVNQLKEVLQRLDHSSVSAPSLADALRRLIQSLSS